MHMQITEPVSLEAPSSHFAPTPQGARLHLLHFENATSKYVPLLLTHGTFSDARIGTRLAAYLQQQGFDTWLFEWRGHGQSELGPVEPDYEAFANVDLSTAVDYVLRRTGRSALSFVGHSAGGVLPWMYLARHHEEARRFRGIVSLASQTTHAGRSPTMFVGLGLAWLVSNIAGRAPSKVFRLGPNDETRGLMNQWIRWNVLGRWHGNDGFDYRSKLSEVSVPALFLAGGGDRSIAPFAGIQQLYADIGTTDKTLLHCGARAGFRENYSHVRIIASRSAEAEIWPRISEWLQQRSALEQGIDA
jgi:oxygen-independent coproporphyrinogen-3 oxidase